MRRLILLLTLVLVAGGLAACRRNTSSPSGEGGTLGLFDWARQADAIIVRLDSRAEQESPADALNSLPPCTIWGDGRVVWTTRNPATGEDVLEARIDEATLRAFIENIISRGFYTWQDELVPPALENPMAETITVSLYGDVRTVRRYSTWPQNSFSRILDDCRHLSDTPVRVLPRAGWISAYPIDPDPSLPGWTWPAHAPFTLRELAASNEARWLEGDLAAAVWQSARENGSGLQVFESDGQAFEVAIVVPGYSRDAGPAPPAES